jgi:hypothetical protein
MNLNISNKNDINTSLNNFSFIVFAKKNNIKLPNDNGFNTVVDELSFVMAYKGFVEGSHFVIDKPDIIRVLSKNIPNFVDVKSATLNLHFMYSARKINLLLPNFINNDYVFNDLLDQVSFKMFYLGWKEQVNTAIKLTSYIIPIKLSTSLCDTV